MHTKEDKKVEREKTLLSDFKTFDGREQIKFEIQLQLQLKHFGSRLSEEKTSSLEFVLLFFFFILLLALLLLNIYLYCWNNI